MEPTDQPPPTPQTWAETSAWATASESTEEGAAPAPAAWTPPPAAVAPPPTADDYVRPAAGALPGRSVKVRRDRPAVFWLALAAAVAELVVIALGCNQWVTQRVANYTGATPQPGFLHQFVYATQTFAWRLTSASHESTSQWGAALIQIAVAVILSAGLVALIARRSSFWRSAAAALLAVVFSTQVAAIVAESINSPGPQGYTGYLPYTPDSGYVAFSQGSQGSPGSSGGGSITNAIFDAPTGYRFVGGLILGVLVAIVVGIVARRLGDGEPQLRSYTPPAPQAPPQTFFPAGEMQRGYEAAQGAPPKLAEPGSFGQNPESGRHSRE
jgi:hypothetical protein